MRIPCWPPRTAAGPSSWPWVRAGAVETAFGTPAPAAAEEGTPDGAAEGGKPAGKPRANPQVQLIRLLADAGADVKLVGKIHLLARTRGGSALHYTVRGGGNRQVIQQLLTSASMST